LNIYQGNLKKQHRDSMFRWFFKEPKHFLHLLKHCRQQELTLTEDDIEPFDLESTVAIRVRHV